MKSAMDQRPYKWPYLYIDIFSLFLAPDIGGKEKEYMKGKIKYTDVHGCTTVILF
jgi:hypothetical protein